MKTYAAPWGTALKITSLFMLGLALCFIFGASLLPAKSPLWSLHLLRWTLPTIVLLCLPFMVLSYTITETEILIRRPFWTTRLSRSGLQSAEFIPKAMNRSMRLCGNGGAFSFTGWFWKSSLGNFRAFVTDLNRTVVLRISGKTIVVSPGDPQAFVEELIS